MEKREEKPWKLHRFTELFLVSLKLGLTSFGGPTAHLGYFHNEYVKKKKWIDEHSYADLVALCQFLPGPASSQVGMGIGMMRGGILGGLLSFLGFSLPSIILLSIFALFIKDKDIIHQGWVSGLKIVALIIVFQAVMDMAKKLANGKIKGSIAILCAAAVFIWASNGMQLVVIAAAGLTGFLLLKGDKKEIPIKKLPLPITKTSALVSFILFLILLIIPFVNLFKNNFQLELFEQFFRAGSLVFGGGHVVLPWLEKILVPPGYVSKESFLAGYGAAQAVPGPLFTFSSYLGAAMGGWKEAIWFTIAIFLPAFLLVAAALPFWDYLRNKPGIQGILHGVNAGVVGILLAALYNPIFVNAISTAKDFALAVILYGLLTVWKLPPWMIVLAGAAAGALFLGIH